MMAIGDLYSKGNGVSADKVQAQSWQAKAESCQDGNLARLQQQISEYRARAAAAREPVAVSILGAIPVLPRLAPRPSQNGQRSGFGWNSDSIGALIAAAGIVAAINGLLPGSGPAADVMPPGDPIDFRAAIAICGQGGLGVDSRGNCSH